MQAFGAKLIWFAFAFSDRDGISSHIEVAIRPPPARLIR
jgi:hypothetical protein